MTQDNFDAARDSLVSRLEQSGITKVSAEQLLGQSNDQSLCGCDQSAGYDHPHAYSFGSLMANGKAHGYARESGFTSEMSLPARRIALRYNLARIPPRLVRQLFDSNEYRPPTPLLNQAAYGTGFVPIDSDDDGVMRAQIMVARFHDGNRVPLSLSVLRALAGGNLIINL